MLLIETSNRNQSISGSTLLALVSPYFLANAILYQIGYWRVFEVNVFEYASLGYVATAAIVSAGYQIVVMIAIFAVSWLGLAPARNRLKTWLQEQADRDSSHPLHLLKGRERLLSAIFLAVALLLAVVLPKGALKWNLVALAAAIGIQTLLLAAKRPLDAVLGQFNSLEVRAYLLAPLAALPLFCFGFGNWSAYQRFGTEARAVSIDRDSTVYTYVGRIGEHVFLLRQDTATLVVRSDVDALYFRTE